MTPDPFLVAIESAAQEAISLIDAETDEKVAAVLGEAQRKVDEEINRYIAEAEQEARRKAQRDLNAARVKAQRAEADVCYELYEDFFDSITGDLSRYREDASLYQPVLCALMREATQGFEAGIISIDPRDETQATECMQMLGHSFELRSDIATAGGCVARNGDGTVIRDNTFESRLSRVRDEMEQQIWSVLIS